MKPSTTTTGPGPRHVGLLHGLGASAETWHPLIALLLATATRPTHAIYVDRGLHRALPTTGVQGRLFWLVPGLTLGVAGALQTWRSTSVRAAYDPAVKESMARARTQLGSSMALTVFRDVAFHPLAAESPSVPSSIVLSDDSPAVLPDDIVSSFEQLGWRAHRARGLHHDMHLEDPGKVLGLIRDDL